VRWGFAITIRPVVVSDESSLVQWSQMLMEATDDPRNVDELGQYSSLSTLAVAGFLLGMLSVLAFITPSLVVIPLTAMAVALLAMAKIRSSAGSQTGVWLARAGFFLAILFAVGAVSRVALRDRLSTHFAEAAAQQWLRAVSTDKMEEALEMMTPSGLMKLQLPPAARDAPPSPFDPMVAVDILQRDPLLRALEPAPDSSEITFQLAEGTFIASPRKTQVGCRFGASGTRAENVEFQMVIERMDGPQGASVWMVDSWSLLQPSVDEIQSLDLL
jgi:hypothetical protein